MCHIFLQYHSSFSLLGSASQNFMELMASDARSSSPWMMTMGGSWSFGQYFSSISSIISCISIRVFTNTFSWYTRGSFVSIEEALGFRVMLLKSKANSPVRFGMIFSAKSDSAETTLLDSGFFKEGLPTMIPLTLNSFFSLARVMLMSPPAPCPKQKKGSLGWRSSTFRTKLAQSIRISFMLSRYPLSPADLPCPRWSKATTIYPSLANRQARCAVVPACMPRE